MKRDKLGQPRSYEFILQFQATRVGRYTRIYEMGQSSSKKHNDFFDLL